MKGLENRGSQNKQRRGNRFGSDRCNRLKPCSSHWLHWKGPIDLEKKYKLEQGTIWNWTDHTLPSTAPEKFLDIFYYYNFFFIFKFFITPLIFIFITYSVQLLSCIWLFVILWITAHQGSLSITNSQGLPRLMSIESLMPSNHPSHPPSSPSSAFNLSQHQSLFKWGSSLHQVAKGLER